LPDALGPSTATITRLSLISTNPIHKRMVDIRTIGKLIGDYVL
jgi:hypothetical protein